MSETLRDLITQSDRIAMMLDNAGGELTLEIEEALAENTSLIKMKVDAYCSVIEAMKAKADYAMSRMKEWEKVVSVCERSVENLSERLKHGLETLELGEVHGLEFTARLQANPGKVIIMNESLLPGEFIQTRVETTTTPIKKAIKEAIEKGQDVPGARLERSSRIVMKPSQRKLK